MNDVNIPLTTSYKAKITGVKNSQNVLVPVYYNEAPDDETALEYIVIQSNGFNNVGTKSSQDLKGTITVEVHTKRNKYNNGFDCDYIAGEILKRIYPTVSSKMFDNGFDLDNGIQDVNMNLVNDLPQSYSFKGGAKFVSRKLIFEHLLFFIAVTTQPILEDGFFINGSQLFINNEVFFINNQNN